MRILHVITSLQTGGAEKLMVDLLPRLRDFNNDVELLLFDGSYTPFYYWLEKEGIKIHSLGVIKKCISSNISLSSLFLFEKT